MEASVNFRLNVAKRTGDESIGKATATCLLLGAVVMLVSATASAKPVRRQSNWGQDNGGSATVTAAWKSKVLTGDLLIAAVTYTGGTGTTVTPPAGEGWTLIGTSNNATSIGVALYYIANNPTSRVAGTTEVFGLSNTAAESVLELTEYSGVQLSGPLDVSFVQSGSSNPETLTTPATDATVAGELAFAVWGLLSATTTPGTPTNSFAKITSNFTAPYSTVNSAAPSTTSTTSVHATNLLAAAGGSPISTALTTTPAVTWAGAIATFRVTAIHWIGTGTYGSRGDPVLCSGFFDDDNCWSSTLGGINDSGSPLATDVVFFDSGGTGNCTMNPLVAATETAYSLSVQSGYTGTISKVAQGLALTTGMALGGGTFSVNASVAITATTLTMTGGTFNAGTGTITYSSTVSITGGIYNAGTGSTTMKATTLNGGTFNGSTATETFTGALTVTLGTMTLGSGPSFSGVTTVGSSSTTGVLTLSSGTVTVPAALSVKGAGSQFNAGGTALTISGTTTIDNGGAFNGQTATTLAFGGTLTITNGTVDLSTSAATPTFTGNTAVGAAATNGVLTLNGGAVSLPGTLNVLGAGSQFNAGSTTLSIALKTTLNNGGTFNGNTAAITFGTGLGAGANSVLVTSGTMNLSGAAVSISPGIATDVQVTAGSMTLPSAAGGTVTFPENLTLNGGTLNAGGGTVNVSGTLSITASGTFNGNTASGTFASTTTLTTGTFSVGDAGTTGQWIFTLGADFKTGMTLSFPSNKGWLEMGAGTTLTLEGTVTSNVGAASTLPKIDCNGCSAVQSITIAFTGNSILNINGLEFDNSVAAGVSIANGATYTLFKRLRFQNNVAAGAAGSTHLAITSAKILINAPGCYFDGTAATNVTLSGTNGSPGVRAIFEYQSLAVNGAGAGEALDVDSDNIVPIDNLADNNSSPRFGSVVEWVAASPSDTTGNAVGYPSAAFDWNTFSWYGIYVGYKDATANGTTNVIWVRNTDGSAAYSFSFANTSGDLVGTPWWDTVNETTAGVDANGDGDKLDTDVHVVYVATTTGHVIKLVDSGTTLTQPAMGAWSTDFTSAGVTAITSPLIEDGTNLYFGGTDGSSVNRIFALQIAGGAAEKTLVDNSPTPFASVGAVTAALSSAVYSGKTYVFAGSADVSNQAYVYQVDITGNVAQAVYLGSTGATAGINGSVSVINNRAYAVSDAGKLFVLDATLAGGLTNITGFPFTAAASPIKAAAYVDPNNNNAYFGNNAGALYVVTGTGVALAGFASGYTISGSPALSSAPVYVQSSGVIAVGAADGNVYFVDRQNASHLPSLFKRYFAGTGAVSTVAYNPNTSQYMVSTNDGRLTFINASDVSDPTSSVE